MAHYGEPMNNTPRFGFAVEYVNDIDASTRFYADILGLRVERSSPTFVQFKHFGLATDEPLGGKRELDGPFARSSEIIAGSIDRIDDPQAMLGTAGVRIGAFLAEDGIVWEMQRQVMADDSIGSQVTLGNWAAILFCRRRDGRRRWRDFSRGFRQRCPGKSCRAAAGTGRISGQRWPGRNFPGGG